MNDKDFRELERQYYRAKMQYEQEECQRFRNRCFAKGYHSTNVSHTPEKGRYVVVIDRDRHYDFWQFNSDYWGNTYQDLWAYPEDLSREELLDVMKEIEHWDYTGYEEFRKYNRL